MRIAIINGSHRPHSESGRIAFFVRELLRREYDDHVSLRDLGRESLPLWDEGVWSGDPAWSVRLAPLFAELREADALVVITPEWAGMATPAIKNFFLLCDSQIIAHKPALPISVSASQGGSYPIAELRMSSFKNNHLCWIPEQVVVREVQRSLLDVTAPRDDRDAQLFARLSHALGVLRAYAAALREMRARGDLDLTSFPYGM